MSRGFEERDEKAARTEAEVSGVSGDTGPQEDHQGALVTLQEDRGALVTLLHRKTGGL